MSDLFISWEEYHKKTEELAVKVHEDGWEFNQVVCIAKGGMRVGDVFARIFNLPLAILSVESYKGEGVKNKRGSITFSRDLAKTSPNIGSKVLLVDDLSDSGMTLKKVLIGCSISMVFIWMSRLELQCYFIKLFLLLSQITV